MINYLDNSLGAFAEVILERVDHPMKELDDEKRRHLGHAHGNKEHVASARYVMVESTSWPDQS